MPHSSEPVHAPIRSERLRASEQVCSNESSTVELKELVKWVLRRELSIKDHAEGFQKKMDL